MSEMRIVGLVLEGYYNESRKEVSHLTSKRMVSVDLDKKEEFRNVQHIFDWTSGQSCWALRARDGGWWKIVDAFEYVEPTNELHDDLYPVSYHLTLEQFANLLKEVSDAKKSNLITVSEPQCGAKPTVYAAALKDGGKLELKRHIEKAFSEGFVRPVGISAKAVDDAVDELARSDYAWIYDAYLVEVTRLNAEDDHG